MAYPHLALPSDLLQLQELLLQQQQQQPPEQQQQDPASAAQHQTHVDQKLQLQQQQQQALPSFAELLQQDWQQPDQLRSPLAAAAGAIPVATAAAASRSPTQQLQASASAAAAGDAVDLCEASDADAVAVDESPSPSPVPLLKRLQLVGVRSAQLLFLFVIMHRNVWYLCFVALTARTIPMHQCMRSSSISLTSRVLVCCL
jgi:hypothetical protein